MADQLIDINANADEWVSLNRSEDIEAKAAANEVAPFPPVSLMHRVSGLNEQRAFAQHGCDFFAALTKASPKPLNQFTSLLDFGVGSGRLARMFKGFRGAYVGADIDHELLAWVSQGLPWVQTAATTPRKPLPFGDGQFDGVISISVFTHMNQADCLFYLRELHRVTRPGAYLFLTIHGSRALERAESEPSVFKMLQIPKSSLSQARAALESGSVLFVRQDTGHLTTETYDYGITFTAEGYIRAEWARLFSVKDVRKGAIHDFQDIVVLERMQSRPAILDRVRRLFGLG